MSEKSVMNGTNGRTGTRCKRDGWVKKKLGEVCEIIGGSTPKTKVDEYWDGEYFWVTPAELKGDKWISSTVRTITQEGVQSAHLQLLPKGTVLLSSRAPIGKLAITKVPMFCNQGFKNLVCSESIFNEFAYYFLLHNTELLQSLGVGATFKEISKSIVGNISILLPSIAEQQHIISELDCLNGIIENQKEQLKQLDELAQSIFYDMFGDPVENEKGWNLLPLSNLVSEDCSISYGIVQPGDDVSDGVPIVRPVDLIDTYVSTDNLKRVAKEISDSYKRTILKGDELLICVRGTTGIVSLVTEGFKGFNTTRGIVPLSFNEKINKWFMFKVFQSCGMKARIEELTYGITLKQINLKELRSLPIILPPLPLQQAFASKIEAIEHQKELIKQSLAETETLFNSRMDYYFG